MPKAEVSKKEVKAPVKRRTKGYKLPKPIPKGEQLVDLKKCKWVIGSSVGVGGFGEIYSAFGESEKSKGGQPPYVIKIEPHENGPLFVEMHFYMRVGKKDDMEEWMKKHKIAHLGVPQLYGSGSHECHNEKYRFLVIDRYGQDLWSIFKENNRQFPVATVFKIGLQIIDVLQYIHEKNYVHGDIKGSNLLVGIKKGTENQVYLVDYGLAERYSTKEFKPDKKRAHNGTIEYTSRDAHLGVPTRRGDLEILGFNMLQWIVSCLPWESNLKDPVKVQQQKEEFMSNVTASVKKLKSDVAVPAGIEEFLKYSKKLEHDEEPDYDFCRQLFKDGLKACGGKVGGKLVFKSTDEPLKGKTATPSKATPKKATKRRSPRSISESEGSENDNETSKKQKLSKKKAVTKKVATKKAVNGSDASSVSSWKDCPTAVASNVVRAGEYKKKSPDSDDKVTKKRVKK